MTATTLKVNAKNIPEDLQARDQWVAHSLVWNEARQKYDKQPFNVATGELASSTNPATWGSFDAVLAAYHDRRTAGIGFVFTADDPYAGIDLDSCYDPETDQLTPWAADVVKRFESYTEISPSGRGIHIIVRGALPGSGRKTEHAEVYDQARFFTMTGQVFEGFDVIHERSGELEDFYRSLPATGGGVYRVETDDDLVARAKVAANGEKFCRLWDGSDIDYGGDASAGDLALTNMLVFWCEGDTLRADKLFRQSNRLRDKWDKRHYGSGETYGEHTMAVAFAMWRTEHGGNGGPPLETAKPEPIIVEDFPAEFLTDLLQKFGRQAAETYDTNPATVVCTMLAFASGAMGTLWTTRLNPEWEESALLWIGLVGEPGAKKTPLIKAVGRPYLEWHKTEIGRYNTEYKAHQADRQRLKRDQLGPEPILHQRLIDDTTIEALSKVLESEPRGVLLDRDELTGFVASMNQYKAKGGADRSNWLSIWSGRHITINRKGDARPIYIERPYVSLVGGIQPERLGALLSEDGNDGFLDRFLFSVMSTNQAKARHGSSLEKQTIQRWRSVIHGLLDNEIPALLPLSKEADKLWQYWSERHANERNDPLLDPLLKGFWSKAEGTAMRLALVHQVISHMDGDASDSAIEEPSVEAAWRLLQYFKSTTRKVYSEIGENEMDRRLERVMAFIDGAGGVVTARRLQRQQVAGIKKSTEAEMLLDELHDRGLGEVNKENVTGGRRVTFTMHNHVNGTVEND